MGDFVTLMVTFISSPRYVTNPYLRATPFDIGKPPRVPGGDVALRPVDDSDERRDAAMRWLERRRSARGETLVAVTEEEDLNNALTIYVLDDVAKTWVLVGDRDALTEQLETLGWEAEWVSATDAVRGRF